MISLRCYEPAGRVLTFSPDDLTRHVIAFGATGSGKTTALINPMLQQLVRWRADEPCSRPGLLVLDPKGDDSAEKVRAYARAAGRERDLAVLSIGGDTFYNLLGGLERLEQVESYARRLLSGTRDLGRENAYWTESRDGLVQTALVILLANGHPVTFEDAISFMQAWWFSPDSTRLQPKLNFVRRVLSGEILQPLSRRRLELALSEVKNWATLDGRTKELHRSTLHNALRPILASAAHSLFTPKAMEFSPRSVLEGKILVVSLDAISHPELARLVFRIVRRDFYAAVQSRKAFQPERHRLCGLVADELALSAMPEDVQPLSVIRAKGGFVVAATQSLNGLDEVLGLRGREALLVNFNSAFFFAARERALDEHALFALGTRERRERQRSTVDLGEVVAHGSNESIIKEAICPPGALARLQQHQAFVKLADGSCTEHPVWLEPSFFDAVVEPLPPERDDLARAVKKARELPESDDVPTEGISVFLLHMHKSGHSLLNTPAVLAALWPLCIPRESRNELLLRFQARIPGLESLPSCWLTGLLHWILANPSFAPAITEVAIKSGVLWPKLDRAFTLWGAGGVGIPESINLFIYPSLWRSPSRRHLARLLTERPDLAEELRSLVHPPALEQQEESAA
ncbi:MAG TPA: type IV secretion system DNA-binding domain-containing protein [Terriglobia bacterium]|nr:type IV secretion system DNA-binding domain-containing protein [Terriglobia bacterium]